MTVTSAALAGWIRFGPDKDGFSIAVFKDEGNVFLIPEVDERLLIISFHRFYNEDVFPIDKKVPEQFSGVLYSVGDAVPISYSHSGKYEYADVHTLPSELRSFVENKNFIAAIDIISKILIEAPAFRQITRNAAPKENSLRVRDAEKHDILQTQPLFGKFSDRLVSCIVTKSVPAGATIYAEGDAGTGLYAIAQGTVQTSASVRPGREAVFNLCVKGDIFGEIALLDGRPRTAEAVALTECELVVIERQDFLPLIREEPEMGHRLIEFLCEKLRHTTEQAQDDIFVPPSNRLAKALLHLSEGQEDAPERRIAMTQKALSGITGLPREALNRQLADWVRRKWVRLGRGHIVIVSVEALERIAGIKL